VGAARLGRLPPLRGHAAGEVGVTERERGVLLTGEPHDIAAQAVIESKI